MHPATYCAFGFLVCASSVFAQGGELLVDEGFNLPTGLTYHFPPPDGTPYKRFNPIISAWGGKGGQISVTYGEKLGVGDSGGLELGVAKKPDKNGFLVVNCELSNMQVTSAENAESTIMGLAVDFAANIPTGKRLSVFLVPNEKAVPEELRSRIWANKLVLGKISGEGQYQVYTLKPADLNPDAVFPLVDFVKECVGKGAGGITFSVLWHMDGNDWTEGEGFALDDVKVQLVAIP